MSAQTDLIIDVTLTQLEAKAPGEFKFGQVDSRATRVDMRSFSYVYSQLGEYRAVLACENVESTVLIQVYRGDPEKNVFAKKLKGEFYDRARKIIDRELALNGQKVPPPKVERMSIRELFGRD